MDAPNQAQPPADSKRTGNESTRSPTTSTLGDLVAELDSQLDALAAQIDEDRTSVAAATKQQKQLQADLALLKRAADAVSASRDEANTVLGEASSALASVQDRIDGLPDEEKARIDSALTEIDKGIAGKQTTLAKAETDLQALHQKRADLDRQVAERKHAFDQALDVLSKLPLTIRGSAAPIKRLVTEIKAAADAGQDRKVYVLSQDLGASIKQLQEQVKDDVINAHVDTYNKARLALAELRESQRGNAEAATAQEQTVAASRAEVETARAARKEQLKPLFVAPKEEALATASA